MLYNFQFIFKGATKFTSQGNVKMKILLNNVLQHCPRKILLFLLKKNDSLRGRGWDGTGIPKPNRDEHEI